MPLAVLLDVTVLNEQFTDFGIYRLPLVVTWRHDKPVLASFMSGQVVCRNLAVGLICVSDPSHFGDRALLDTNGSLTR